MERLLTKFSILWVLIALIQFHRYEGCLEEERITLLEIKAAFIPVKNLYTKFILTSWVDDKMSDCCRWERVECKATTGRVMKLSLNNVRHDNHILPVLNMSLFNPLRELQSLDLSENHFEGSWDENKGATNLTNLVVLDLSYNAIRGSVTQPGLSNLKNLKALSLSNNKISGSLSSLGICDLNNLVELDLSSNNFNGYFPHCLSNLTHLKLFDLSLNQLSGYLPSNIANLTSLEYFSLTDNNFEGLFSLDSLENHSKLEVFLLSSQNNTLQVVNENPLFTNQLKVLMLSNCNLHALPSFLLHQYNLRFIDLSLNKLVGAFPTWLLENNTKLAELCLRDNLFIGNLQLSDSKHDLLSLDISKNNFYGQLPENIGTVLPTLEFLSMYENSFEGDIPSSMATMERLQLLDLSSNNFSGEPSHIFTSCFSLVVLKLSNNSFHGKILSKSMNLTKLQWLYLDINNFSGKIGDGLLKAISLQVLDVSDNNISGQIPQWIGNLSRLRILGMSYNILNGNVPIQLSNLQFLSILDISNNRLSGPIPSPFYLLAVNHLYMGKNALNGSIPDSIFKNSELMVLDLSDNEFSGSISSWINELEILHALFLGGNHLQGHIPYQLCQSRNLRILDLARNKLSGPIPSCFTNMVSWMTRVDYGYDYTYLHGVHQYDPVQYAGEHVISSATYNSTMLSKEYGVYYNAYGGFVELNFFTKNRYNFYLGNILYSMTGVDLSSNELTGDIPPNIGELQGIHALNLSNNLLSGSIPGSFSHLKLIESLDLSHNKLSGQIPPQLTELNYLAIFNVSYNNLSGPIPNNWQFGSFDESSYVDNPGLCGPLIKKDCNSSPAVPSSPSNGEKEESIIDMVDFCWSFGGSYVATVLGLLVILSINPYWRMLWLYFIEKSIDLCFYWLSKYVSC